MHTGENVCYQIGNKSMGKGLFDIGGEEAVNECAQQIVSDNRLHNYQAILQCLHFIFDFKTADETADNPPLQREDNAGEEECQTKKNKQYAAFFKIF